jgi:hypothetical protein
MLETQRVLISPSDANAKRLSEAFASHPAYIRDTLLHFGPAEPVSAGRSQKKKPGDRRRASSLRRKPDQALRIEDGSTFTPGPIVEETAMRWM